jgi:hypothetical protein
LIDIRSIRNIFFVMLAWLLLAIFWVVADDPRAVKDMVLNTCHERFSDLRNAPDRQSLGPVSDRFLPSRLTSAVYPVSQQMETVVTDVLQSQDISVDGTYTFRVFDTGNINIQVIDTSGKQIGSYDFDYCGRIF